MANAREITEKQYNKAKRDLVRGMTTEHVAFEHGFGLPRVRLIRKSNTYRGYLQMRRNEAKKRLQNTPARAKAGKHELQQGQSIPELQYDPEGESGISQIDPEVELQANEQDSDEVFSRETKRKEKVKNAGVLAIAAIVILVVIAVLYLLVYAK